jgi:heat-inducible transcriptional repressor
MELERRSNTILQLIVEAYIQNAQPVSSAAVAVKNPELNLSSATIRAVMADLETEGLLHQPHTSAGRIPTERGLRRYLDNMVSMKLRPWDRTRLEAKTSGSDASRFPAHLGQALSGLSGQMAVVAVPRFLGSRLKEVGLVRCGHMRVLAYFVSPHGLVQQKLVQTDVDLTPEELTRVQNYLNAHLAGRTLAQVRAHLQTELEEAAATRDELKRHAAQLGVQLLPAAELEVLVEGTTQLFDQPEFADLGTLRALLRTIEEKELVLRVLDRLLDGRGLQVMLGSEHPLRELPDLACVGYCWEGPGGDRAAISLWGPTRMDYGRLMPLVSYASELLGRFWEQL